jgi:hypothetical protein
MSVELHRLSRFSDDFVKARVVAQMRPRWKIFRPVSSIDWRIPSSLVAAMMPPTRARMESIAETQPKLQPAFMRLSAMISQDRFTGRMLPLLFYTRQRQNHIFMKQPMRGNIPIPELPPNKEVWLIVLVTSVRERRTQQGKPFCDISARNSTGSLALRVWPASSSSIRRVS